MHCVAAGVAVAAHFTFLRRINSKVSLLETTLSMDSPRYFYFIFQNFEDNGFHCLIIFIFILRLCLAAKKI
jgi:hypothetical protein